MSSDNDVSQIKAADGTAVAAVGCLGGVIAVGALGTIAGQLLVTAPVIVAAAIQYFTTINSPLPQR
ncbi:hypothetical protein [Nocardia sp. CA-120079]|uniref:hypothetical protein n=1 Tax=Nocardia sp. CA-120079 TaxID=3239974 RepID=UPI003D9736BD